MRVFHKDGDYAAFERVMRDTCEAVPVRVLAYSLMRDHFSLVLWPRGDGETSGGPPSWSTRRLTRPRPVT